MSTKYSGLEAALRSARMTFVSEANAGDRTGTEIIACEDLLPAWTFLSTPSARRATVTGRRRFLGLRECRELPGRDSGLFGRL